MLLDLVDRVPCDAAVKGYEVNTVLSVKPDDIDKIPCRQCGEVSLVVNDRIVNRNGADHGRAF